MGNVAAADQLAGIEELDELYRLNASESGPEDEEEEEAEGDEEEDGEKPEVMGHP
jgi:hypothetical protein